MLNPLEECDEVRVVMAVVLIDAAGRAAVADCPGGAGARGGRRDHDAERCASDGDEEDTGRDRLPATGTRTLPVRTFGHGPLAADQRAVRRRRRSSCIPTQASAAAIATTPGGPIVANRRLVWVLSCTALDERHDMIDQRD